MLSCATPCPRDIKVGSIQFDQATTEFIPTSTNFKVLTFTNDKGKILTFTTTASSVVTPSKIPVKVLCQKGDFIDKTSQVEYLDASSVNLWYATVPERYTLAVDIVIDGFNPNTGVLDTAFIEKLTVWGQRVTTPSKVGTMSIVTSSRGNDQHPEIKKILNQPKEYAIIKDTTILNRNMQNVYYNPASHNGMTIYFTKENGIEAFKTDDNEIWVRK
jgi:hypothetical protein